MTKAQRRAAARALTPRIKLLREGLKDLDRKIERLYMELYRAEKKADLVNAAEALLRRRRRKLLEG